MSSGIKGPVMPAKSNHVEVKASHGKGERAPNPPPVKNAPGAGKGTGVTGFQYTTPVGPQYPDDPFNFGNPTGASSGGGSSGASAGILAAGQAAAAKQEKDITALYGALSHTLGLNIAGEDKNYDSAIGGVGNAYSALRGQVGGDYANSRSQLDSELTRLGQGDMLGQQHAKQNLDQNWIQSILGAQGQGTKDSLGLLKQGAHSYNTAVTGEALTEGANQVAAIKAALAKAAAARRGSGGGGSKAKNPGLGTNLVDMFKNLGGTGGGALSSLWDQVLGNPVATRGNPIYGTDANGNKIITGYDSANSNQLAQEFIKEGNSKYHNPANQKIIAQLAELIAHTKKYGPNG